MSNKYILKEIFRLSILISYSQEFFDIIVCWHHELSMIFFSVISEILFSGIL